MKLKVTFFPDEHGTTSLSVKASDSQSAFVIDESILTVSSVNDVPAFSLSGDVTVAEDFANVQQVTVTPVSVPSDERDQSVSYTLSPSTVDFALVSIDSSTGQVSISSIADLHGSQVFTVTADDGQSINNVASQTFTLTVKAVNDAPVLDNTVAMVLKSMDEDLSAYNNLGTRMLDMIASAVGDRITDVDQGAVEGITVTSLAMADGTWQYDLSLGAGWTDFPAVSETQATLLADTARVRFIPKLNFNGTASLTFRAWDQVTDIDGDGVTDGWVSGDVGVDVSVYGGITSFSNASQTAAISVNPVNDQPLTEDLTVQTNEDTTVNIVLSAIDVDGDELMYSILSFPSHG